jgi:Na+-transporting NADH:ubiquinone oxidoreductase subunit B
MDPLRNALDKAAPLFEKGGKLERFHALYEMQDTILYTPGDVTTTAAHVRDGMDLKRMMFIVVIALIPCILWCMYNTGYQAQFAIASGAAPLESWQTSLLTSVGFSFTNTNAVLCLIHGALYYLPVLAVCMGAGGAVEAASAMIRGHEINEGFLVTGMLLPLTLPPTIPLWMVALGVAFGIIFGKEVFGGTGMNFLNPALVGRAFLFFAYPAWMSGDAPWIAADFIAIDSFSGATWLAQAAVSSGALEQASWWRCFFGLIPGSMGETSTFACLLGAVLLLVTRIGSWRTMAGVALGTLAVSLLLNLSGSTTNPLFAVPFHWHVVLGGWAFGMVFMATDPVSSAFTARGKWLYGIGIGTLAILIRVVNPAYPEGMMLAILFMNMFAPLIDHFVVQANIKRRAAGYAI